MTQDYNVRDALARHRARLEQLRAELEAEQLVVQGLEQLDRLHRERPAEGGRREPTEPELPGTEESPSPGNTMTAKEAIERLLQGAGAGKSFRVYDLASEIERRGWPVKSKRLEDAIRTALLRGVEEGELVRRGRGLYAWRAPHEGKEQPNGGTEREASRADERRSVSG